MNQEIQPFFFCAQAYKAGCVAAAREYLVSGQPNEVAAALQELGRPELRHVFVKHVRPPYCLPLSAPAWLSCQRLFPKHHPNSHGAEARGCRERA
jgi:hypothetical protein